VVGVVDVLSAAPNNLYRHLRVGKSSKEEKPMARTYKDNQKFRGRKGKRNERGENRGRRWADDENTPEYGRTRRHVARRQQFDGQSGENLD